LLYSKGNGCEDGFDRRWKWGGDGDIKLEMETGRGRERWGRRIGLLHVLTIFWDFEFSATIYKKI
jgi:hypothetical protein